MNDFARALVAALRSGEYPQARHSLREVAHSPRARDAYCILGLACELYRLTYGEGEWDGEVFIVADEDAAHYVLPLAVRDALGFQDSLGSYNRNDLMSQNDRGVTFAQLAGIIESEPEGLFVEEERS